MRRQVYQPLAPAQPSRPMAYPTQGQVYYSNQFVQQQPQVITVQTHPQTGAMYHHGQVFSSGNQMGTWLNPGYGQNIMIVQSPAPSQSQILPLVAPYRSVAPQTTVSNASTNEYNSPPAWTQIRPRRRISVTPSLNTLLPNYNPWATAENETQTNESFSQVQPQIQPRPASQQKSYTSNQTFPNQSKPAETPDTESKEEPTPETKSSSGPETSDEELEAKRLSQQLSVNFQAIMASSPEVTEATVSSSSSIRLSVDIVADTALTISAPSPIVSSTVFPMTASVAPVMTSETSMLTTSSSLPEDSDISVTADSISVPDATKEVVSQKLSPTAMLKSLSPFNLLDDIDIQDSDIVDSLRMKATEVAEILMMSPKEGMSEKRDKELSPPIEKSLLMKEKHTPKAIVKPQVMTHVTDGLDSQEVPEPFLTFKSSLKSHPEYQETSSEMPKICEEFQTASPKKLKMNSYRGRKRGRRGRRGRPKLLNLTEEMDVKEIEDVALVKNPVEAQKVGECSSIARDVLPVSETSVTLKMDEGANVSEITHTKKLPQEWNVEEVFEFIREFPDCSDYAETFRSQEIDGQALLLLKVDHLVTAMCMKLGPAVKLMAHLNNLKDELSLQAST